MSEITFNNKSASDFGLILSEFIPQPPSPKLIKDEVPFMNGSYDFSNLYGEQTYDERKIKCKLQLVEKSGVMLYIKYSEVLQWLLGSGKAILKYSNEPGLYYMARVENAPSWDKFSIVGVLDFDFVAYPFKYGENTEGNDLWNSFNFETDYAQSTKFNVSGSQDITLYNPGAKRITPSVICSTQMQVIKGATTYNFKSGTSKDWRFSLDLGENNLTLKGNGTIEFLFRKEVL